MTSGVNQSLNIVPVVDLQIAYCELKDYDTEENWLHPIFVRSALLSIDTIVHLSFLFKICNFECPQCLSENISLFV